MRKSKAKKRHLKRKSRREIKIDDWSECKDNICRICGKEITGTILVYLKEPYHGACMYPGP